VSDEIEDGPCHRGLILSMHSFKRQTHNFFSKIYVFQQHCFLVDKSEHINQTLLNSPFRVQENNVSKADVLFFNIEKVKIPHDFFLELK
jgi:hypothetical protein